MKKLSLIILLLFSSISSYSFISEMALDPLDQTGTARPIGMGGAFISVSDDVNSLFYNPAGLADSKGLTVNFSGSNKLSIGVAYGTSIGNFGLGYVSKNYDAFKYAGIKTNYESSLLLLGYGVEMEKFYLGLNLKTLMSQRISQTGIRDLASNTGYDMDGGLIYKMNQYTSFALLLHNFMAGKYKLGSSDEAFPSSIKYGIAMDILGKNAAFNNDTYGIKAALDLENMNVVSIGPRVNSFIGFEGSYNGWLFARAGGSVYDRFGSSSYGIGCKNGDASIDIAVFKEPLTGGQVSYLSVSYFPPQFVLAASTLPRAPEGTRAKEVFTLIAPEDGFITYDENVNITGRAEPKSSILVNGINVYLSDDGRFNALQPLLPGKNLIEIEGSLGQKKKTEQRKVLKKAKVVIAEEQSLNKIIDEEITKKEAELNRREESLKNFKLKGIDVSMEERSLAEERKKLEIRKAELYGAKEKMKERKEKVENLVTLGVIEVSKDKSFAIESKITRGEMITWLVRAAELPIPRVEGPVFSDVPANNIYAPYIKAAADAGIIRSLPDGKFRPYDPVTEEEGEALFRAFGIVR